MRAYLFLLLALLSGGLTVRAQGTAATPEKSSIYGSSTPTLADELGYPPGTRLLVLHADDLGMAHSVNAASFKALLEGSVNSASIMMPTPWVAEVAAFAKTHPDADLGLHLTLTSEWTNYRWGPMSRDSVNGLLDEHHYLHGLCHEMAETATVEEVVRELRAQVEQALRLGIKPTHLDSHMGCLVYTKPEFFQAYLEVGRQYNLPILLDRSETLQSGDTIAQFLQPSDMRVDQVLGIPEDAKGNFAATYSEMLRNLAPGVSVVLLHCAYDNAEFQAAAAPQIDFGAKWRQEDFDFFTSPELKALLKEENIQLVTWRELWASWQGK